MTLGLSPVPPRNFMQPIIPSDQPVYRITAMQGFYGPDDVLYPEGSIVIWTEEPIPDMEPLNDLATKSMQTYLKKLDTAARVVAEKAGKSYVSMADAFENSLALEQQNVSKIKRLGEREMVPLMGSKKRGRPKIQKLDVNQGTPVTSAPGKLSVRDNSEGLI